MSYRLIFIHVAVFLCIVSASSKNSGQDTIKMLAIGSPHVARQGYFFPSNSHFSGSPTTSYIRRSLLLRGGFGGVSKKVAASVGDVNVNTKEGLSISHNVNQVDSLRSKTRQWKRKESFALFLLRIGFLISLPLSVIFLTLSLTFWLISMVLRILTLNLTCREISKIGFVMVKMVVALMFASVTGIFLPVFAMFGLVASAAAAVAEIAEPVLRIRYRRLLRKLNHLQKILSDPVLLETVDVMSRGAKALTAATSNQIQKTSLRAIEKGKKGIERGKLKHDTVRDTSTQLIETLLQSPDVIELKEKIQKRLPDPVAVWSRDQLDLLRRSGVLEEAAAHALNALSRSKEFCSAALLLPYIEAIIEVRRKQEHAEK